MTRAEARDLLARLSPDTRARVSAATIAAVHEVATRRVSRQTWAQYDSKWEMEMAYRLEVLQLVGEVTAWEHHPAPLIALGGTKYTPDFLVTRADGQQYVEVKGYARSRDLVRMREAAAVSTLPIVVMSKRKGVWCEVRRYPAGKAT